MLLSMHKVAISHCYKHDILVVSGEEGRKTFFGHKDLNFLEGYRILFGAVRIPSFVSSLIFIHLSDTGTEDDGHQGRESG